MPRPCYQCLYAGVYEGHSDNCLGELLINLGGIEPADKEWGQTWLFKMVNKNWGDLKIWPHNFTI